MWHTDQLMSYLEAEIGYYQADYQGKCDHATVDGVKCRLFDCSVIFLPAEKAGYFDRDDPVLEAEEPIQKD